MCQQKKHEQHKPYQQLSKTVHIRDENTNLIYLHRLKSSSQDAGKPAQSSKNKDLENSDQSDNDDDENDTSEATKKASDTVRLLCVNCVQWSSTQNFKIVF